MIMMLHIFDVLSNHLPSNWTIYPPYRDWHGSKMLEVMIASEVN